MQLEQQPLLQHKQNMRLSTQMLHSLDILSMQTLDLQQRIIHEMDVNPALEIVDNNHDASLDAIFEEFDNIEYDQTESEWADASVTTGTKELSTIIEHTSSSEQQSLHDVLQKQLYLCKMNASDYAYGNIIINNLDDNGFHIIDPYTHSKLTKCTNLSDLIAVIQKFEPWGICVYNIEESLILQSVLHNNAPDNIEAVIKNYFTLLEKRKFNEIARALSITNESVRNIYKYVCTLTPYPGKTISVRHVQYVTPDLEILFDNNNYHISIHESAYPQLNINKLFLSIKSRDSKEDNAFVKSYIQQAQWFIGTLHKRNHTLLRAAYALLHRQHRFFRLGPSHIRPLKLQDIADMLLLHEATISRIVSKKYIQTNWGIYPLSYLFSSKVSSNSQQHSKQSVKSIIKQIILNNDHTHLSDQKIVNALQQQGITIARRTVTKYRHELDIPAHVIHRTKK